MALEGNEVEGKLGNAGGYKVDVKDDGTARVELDASGSGVKGGLFLDLDIVEILKAAAAKTSNGVDDAIVGTIAKAFGR